MEDKPVIPDFLERRSFLTIIIAFGTVAIGAMLSIPLLRFAFHPLLAKTTETGWSTVGSIDEFISITGPVKRIISVEQRDGWRKNVSDKAVYVIKKADSRLVVLSPICPHLGCPIAWSEEKKQFLCPCHVGIFAPDGAKVAGPPPREMDELNIKIEGKKLLVQYQYFRSLVPTKEVMA
ncbi:MAG: ubiquinol-cytochrome c reductase iron-sulfur subunit [Bdellovibrionota bacterium]